MPTSRPRTLPLWLTWFISGLILLPFASQAGTADGVRPLLVIKEADLTSVIPSGARLLHNPRVIEEFLDALDEAPPDWATIYGPDGKGHDDRLFDLNRRRDSERRGNPATGEVVTFLWSGELSAYDPSVGGFRVAIGPEIIATRWGLVRFKPEELPGEMVAIPSPDRRDLCEGNWPRVSGSRSSWP